MFGPHIPLTFVPSTYYSVIMDSGGCLLPVQHQGISWTSHDMLPIGPKGNNFNEIRNEIQITPKQYLPIYYYFLIYLRELWTYSVFSMLNVCIIRSFSSGPITIKHKISPCKSKALIVKTNTHPTPPHHYSLVKNGSPLRCWGQNIPWKSGQQHCCWCPGILCYQVSSIHRVNIVVWMDFYLPWWGISATCTNTVLMKDSKWEYVSMLPQN